MSLACVLLLCFLAERVHIYTCAAQLHNSCRRIFFCWRLGSEKGWAKLYYMSSLSRTKYYMRIHKFLTRSVFYFSVIFYIYIHASHGQKLHSFVFYCKFSQHTLGRRSATAISYFPPVSLCAGCTLMPSPQ